VPRLSEIERERLPGSFIRLSRGFVHYELSGPEGAPLVVLVPGLSVPYSTWERNAPVLAARGFRVLRYEHYGRGYSDRPRAAYDLELYVEQLAELLHALGLTEPSLLVGLSMGGPVAAAMARRHPGLVWGLALVDPLFEWPAQRSLARFLLLPMLGEAIMVLGGAGSMARGQRGDFSSQAEFEAYIPSYLPPFRYSGIPRAVLATLRSIPSWPLRESFEGLGSSGLPVLLLWGSEDAILPIEQGERLHALLSGAEFRRIEGAGHVPQWEKPEEVNGALLDFLSRRLD
jgi:pimeloyl-ACP methyl ester carboxylesterase